MHRLKSLAGTLVGLACAHASLFVQSSPWLSIGGGFAMAAAQDKSYTSSTSNVEQVGVTWRVHRAQLTTEAVLVQSRYGDADVCDRFTRPCPQIYGLAGGAILLPLRGLNADGTPEMFGGAVGLGMYSVRPPRTGNRLAPAIQADFELALVQQPHMDLFVLGSRRS